LIAVIINIHQRVHRRDMHYIVYFQFDPDMRSDKLEEFFDRSALAHKSISFVLRYSVVSLNHVGSLFRALYLQRRSSSFRPERRYSKRQSRSSFRVACYSGITMSLVGVLDAGRSELLTPFMHDNVYTLKSGLVKLTISSLNAHV